MNTQTVIVILALIQSTSAAPSVFLIDTENYDIYLANETHYDTRSYNVNMQPLYENCTDEQTQCSNHGVCSKKNSLFCICDDGYTTINQDSDIAESTSISTRNDSEKFSTRSNTNGVLAQCSYKRKSQLVSFLLAFFIGYTGAPYFYVERLPEAISILVLTCAFIPFICIACCAGFSGCGESFSKFLAGIVTLCGCAAGAWWTVCWIQFAIGNISDGNGVELARW